MDDIATIDQRILDKAMNVGLNAARKLTPTGIYPDVVSFTTRDGKHVSFKVTKRTGGAMRREWRRTRTFKTKTYVSATLYNNVEYASFVNYGHRVVNRHGETIGWVNGKFMLQKASLKIERAIEGEFVREINRIEKTHN